MSKKKKSSSKFATFFTVFSLALVVLGIYAAYQYVLQPKGELAPTAKQGKLQEPVAYLNLNVDEGGLLRDQRVLEKAPPPPVLPFRSKTELQSPIAKDSPVLDSEFLSVRRPGYQKDEAFFARRYQPVLVDISGELARFPLKEKSEKLNHVRFAAHKQVKPFYISFNAQLNHETGKIFWHQVEQSSGNAHVDNLASKLVRTLSFETDEKEIISRGKVSFVLRLEKDVVLLNALVPHMEQLEEVAFDPSLQEFITDRHSSTL